MTEFERESLYRRMAAAYVRTEGAALLAECAALPDRPTPRLDARVRRAIGARRAAGWLPGIALLAASFLVVLLVGQPWSGVRFPAAPSTAAEAPADAPDVSGGEAASEFIALGFDLPENLTVASVKEDRGQTIYSLAEAAGDDVVLTLEYPSDAPDFSDLHPITVAGETVFGVSQPGYHLLAFEREGVRYELTCKYELTTLTDLAEVILL